MKTNRTYNTSIQLLAYGIAKVQCFALVLQADTQALDKMQQVLLGLQEEVQRLSTACSELYCTCVAGYTVLYLCCRLHCTVLLLQADTQALDKMQQVLLSLQEEVQRLSSACSQLMDDSDSHRKNLDQLFGLTRELQENKADKTHVEKVEKELDKVRCRSYR